MGQEVQIAPDSPERTAKIRHPVAVVIWSVVTFGIYYLYWWYQINRELADLGRARGVDGLGEKPIWSLLAFFPGGLLIIPPYFSIYNAVKRMQRAQEITLGEASFNGWIVLILLLGSYFTLGISGLIVPGYFQSDLNKVWETALRGRGATPDVPATPSTAVTPPEPPQQA
jgi:hypothetical protein